MFCLGFIQISRSLHLFRHLAKCLFFEPLLLLDVFSATLTRVLLINFQALQSFKFQWHPNWYSFQVFKINACHGNRETKNTDLHFSGWHWHNYQNSAMFWVYIEGQSAKFYFWNFPGIFYILWKWKISFLWNILSMEKKFNPNWQKLLGKPYFSFSWHGNSGILSNSRIYRLGLSAWLRSGCP